MVLDGLRGYLQLANGLNDVTRERALAAAKALVAQGEAVGAALPPPVRAQVSTLTEDLLAASKANRDLLLHLVRVEVERSVARLGLVSAQELDAATRRATGLERRVRELEEELSRSTATRKAAAKKTAKKSAAKKSAAKKSAAKKSAAKKSTKKSTAKKTVATEAAPTEAAATEAAAPETETAATETARTEPPATTAPETGA
jgi:polyhydroxyalkanoate synthesis regulator phasin